MRCETCGGEGLIVDAEWLAEVKTDLTDVGAYACPDCNGTGERKWPPLTMVEIYEAAGRVVAEMEPLPADFAKVWDDNADTLYDDHPYFGGQSPLMKRALEVIYREGGERVGEFGKGGWQ